MPPDRASRSAFKSMHDFAIGGEPQKTIACWCRERFVYSASMIVKVFTLSRTEGPVA